MENLLEQTAPRDLLDRAEAFARDLAYGVVNELWDIHISRFISTDSSWEIVATKRDAGKLFQQYIQRKWAGNPPSMHLMQALGYLELYQQPSKHQNDYFITEKALCLLKAPAQVMRVALIHDAAVSSALALLIEARLKYIDPDAEIFVNKAFVIEGATPAYLRQRIMDSRYVVVLLGQSAVRDASGTWQQRTAFDLPALQQQIQWALNAQAHIVTLCHDGYALPNEQGSLSDELWQRATALHTQQHVAIRDDSTAAYDYAITQLLNLLGYSTY